MSVLETSSQASLTPGKRTYDVVVIGSGIGGAAAALTAASEGLSVLVVDKGPVGGTCVNVGCVPTKYLLRVSGHVADSRSLAGLGILGEAPRVDIGRVMARKRELIGQVIAWYTDLVFPSYGIDLAIGRARLRDRRSVVVNGSVVEARKAIVVATGSEPVKPSIPGLDEALETGCAVFSDAALGFEEVPGRLVVIGGGPVGLELATVWHGFGSEVTVVEMMPRILPGMDPDVSKVLSDVLESRGISVRAGERVERIEPRGCRVVTGKGVYEADRVLVATGRRPRSRGMGLEEVGVRLGPKGGVVVDDRMRTSVEGVYAVGDVTGDPLLASKAKAQGIIAGLDIAGKGREFTRHPIPMVVFTDPEAASVGVSAGKGDPRYLVKRFPAAVNYRAIVHERMHGVAKVVADRETGRIVGFHMVGLYASEVVNSAAVAIAKGMRMDEALDVIFSHPVMSEVFLDAIHLALGHNVYLPRR